MDIVLAFLLSIHCAPTAVITPSNATFFLNGVVYVRPDMMKPEILVHELYHACQYEKAGNQSAKSWGEWQQREYDAKIAEILFNEKHEGDEIEVWYGVVSD